MGGIKKLATLLAILGGLAGCSSLSSVNPFPALSVALGGGGTTTATDTDTPTQQATRVQGGSVVAVNRYLWTASLDVLSFLPLQSVDPFTGVIITGFGTPPGGNRAYRATVLVQDPALDARALKVALFTQSGPADPDTVRAVEDAILTRARQLRSGQ